MKKFMKYILIIVGIIFLLLFLFLPHGDAPNRWNQWFNPPPMKAGEQNDGPKPLVPVK
jgi:hypothetical protein